MRERPSLNVLSCAALLAAVGCSSLLDTSELGPGGNGGDAGASGDAGGSSAGAPSAGGGAAAGESSAGAPSAGASSAGAASTAGAPAAGGPNGCVPTDKKEVCDGLDNDCDAATPDVCPSGCSGFAVDGVGHMACSKSVSFGQAQLACFNQGMLVVCPNTQAENAEVLAHAAGLGSFVWLGAQDEQSNHSLQWPDGTVVATNGVPTAGVYNDFAVGEPVVLGGPNCLRMATRGADAGSWSSVACSTPAAFVCEPLF